MPSGVTSNAALIASFHLTPSGLWGSTVPAGGYMAGSLSSRGCHEIQGTLPHSQPIQQEHLRHNPPPGAPMRRLPLRASSAAAAIEGAHWSCTSCTRHLFQGRTHTVCTSSWGGANSVKASASTRDVHRLPRPKSSGVRRQQREFEFLLDHPGGAAGDLHPGPGAAEGHGACKSRQDPQRLHAILLAGELSDDVLRATAVPPRSSSPAI